MRKPIAPVSLTTTLLFACLAGCQNSPTPEAARSVSDSSPRGLTSTAEAVIRVSEQLPNGDTASEAAQRAYCETCSGLLGSQFVVQSALRSPIVMQLPIIQRHEYPAEWLENQLQVETTSGSLIVAKLAGRPSEEKQLTQVLDAIVHAFEEEVAQVNRSELTQRLQDLRDEQRKLLKEISDNNGTLQRLASTVPVGRDSEISFECKRLTERAKVSHERIISLAKRMDDLWIRSEAAGDDLSRRLLKSEHDATVTLISKVKADYEKYMTELETLMHAPRDEWEEAKLKIEFLRSRLKTVMTDDAKLQSVLKQGPRIRVMQTATIVHDQEGEESRQPMNDSTAGLVEA